MVGHNALGVDLSGYFWSYCIRACRFFADCRGLSNLRRAAEPFGTLKGMSAAMCDFADILVTLFGLILSVGAMCFVFLATAMQMGMELIR